MDMKEIQFVAKNEVETIYKEVEILEETEDYQIEKQTAQE